MSEKWIQGAIKHKGALHKELGVKEGEKIPAKKLEEAAKKKGVEGRRARLAETLKKMSRRHHIEAALEKHMGSGEEKGETKKESKKQKLKEME